MERFRGDSFKKTLEIENYTFQPDDIVKFAIMKNPYSKEKVFEDTILIDSEKDSVDLIIPIEKTKEFPIGNLIFEIEVTCSGIVKTYQEFLEVKADGIKW